MNRQAALKPTFLTASANGRYRDFLLCLVILACGLTAYHNSFSGEFVFDDHSSIVRGEKIRAALWPPNTFFRGTIRPVLHYTLAINYRWGGLDVTGYHIFNVAIHLAVGLALYGVIRRSLLRPVFQDRFATSAPWYALACATIWVVHPLPTQAVDYVIQRSESMTALSLMLVLYGQVRSVEAKHRWPWYLLSIMALLLGIGCKPIMAVAPLVVLLYDRVFLSSSWREVFQQRWLLYVGLLPVWLLSVYTVSRTVQINLVAEANQRSAAEVRKSVSPAGGPSLQGGDDIPTQPARASRDILSPWEYFRSQPGVLLHYLKRVVIPRPLCLDYRWPKSTVSEAILPALIVTALFVGSIVALFRWPPIGFLGCAFFILLAPTSSFVPIEDLAVEHRMYLPSAIVIILIVFAVCWLLANLVRRTTWPATATVRLLVALWCLALITLGSATIARHEDYADTVRLWDSVLDVNPGNVRAMNHRASALLSRDRVDDAHHQLLEAIRIEPFNEFTLVTLAEVAHRRGLPQQRLELLEKALITSPHNAVFENNAGAACEALGQWEPAIEHYRRATQLKPSMVEPYKNLGFALTQVGDIEGGLAAYRTALRLDPDYFHAHLNLGFALIGQKRFQPAISHLNKALALRPDDIDALEFLALAYARAGNDAEAASGYRRAAKRAEAAGDRQRAQALREQALRYER